MYLIMLTKFYPACFGHFVNYKLIFFMNKIVGLSADLYYMYIWPICYAEHRLPRKTEK